MSGLTVQEFTTFEALADFREEWNGLVRSENKGPEMTYEWLSTLWQLHGSNRELLVLVVRDDGAIAGIAPLIEEESRRKGVRVRMLSMLSGRHSLHGTPFLLGGRKQQALEAIFEVLRRRKRWTSWTTSYQVGDEQESALYALFLRHGYFFTATPGVRSPYQCLQETWEEKLKSLQPRFRTALRSREKRLREKGRLELRFVDSSAAWKEGLEAIREIEEDSWKVEAGTAITVQDFQWQFYSRYAPIAAETSTLRIPVLYIDGEPIAYDYALLDNGIYYLLKTSYKNKWRELYPGFVLRKLLVEWSYAQGVREIDYLGKDEDWKMKWTNQVREHRNVHVFGRDLAGRYLHVLNRLAAFVRRGDQKTSDQRGQVSSP